MHLAPPLSFSSTQPSSTNFSSPITKKRVYDCKSNSFARSPLRNVRSKIRSAWGDLREFIGMPSEIRRLRNALPATLGAADRAPIEKLMVHLNATGERALHARLDRNLQILQLNQRIENTDSMISDANKNLQHYEAQANKLKLDIEELKQRRRPELPQEVLADLDRANSKLLLAQFAPLLVTVGDVLVAKQHLETALGQLPSTTALDAERELMRHALTMIDSLTLRQADPDRISSIAQEGIATLEAIAELSASVRECNVNLARNMASKEAELNSAENSFSDTSDNLQAIEQSRNELQQQLNEHQAALAQLPPL